MMHIPSSTCPVCKKPKGGYTKRLDHSECSRILQGKYKSTNDRRNEAKTNRASAVYEESRPDVSDMQEEIKRNSLDMPEHLNDH